MRYYFIGTDEAGYGPNLGPLVVSASAWEAELPISDSPVSLFNQRVEDVLERSGHFVICDSKKLYHSGHLAPLERSFFLGLEMAENEEIHFPLFCAESSFSFLGHAWNEIIFRLAVSSEAEKRFLPAWEEDANLTLPIINTDALLQKFESDLQETVSLFDSEKIRLTGIRSRRVQPEEFNLLLIEKGLKSDLLADITFKTAFSLLEPLLKSSKGPRKIFLCCDKLGGRNCYTELLQKFFPDVPVTVLLESREKSLYRLQPEGDPLTVIFQAKGESNIPTAMASIVSKYLREISMELFNRWWRKIIPNLEPTAGYPLDAKRFRIQTESVRRELGIADRFFWRNK